MTNTLSIYPSERIGRAVSDCLSLHKDRKVLLLVSGGSVLKILDGIDESSLSKNATVSVLDERLGDDLEASNFIQLTRTNFFYKAKERGVKFIRMDEWPPIIKGQFVVVLMGVGLDGHTAGIMPFPEDPNKFKELFEGEKLVVEYDAGEKNKYPLRQTATVTFLRDIVDQAFIYVSGEEKREILKTILESKKEIEKYPARVVHSMKKVELHTDLTK